jgi:predicted metal-dependent phosphoesterase TrpH
MKLDLHIHTTTSDGAWSPEAVVRGAAEGGLDVIAVADHDTTAAFAAAAAVGVEVRVQVIPALEVSSTHEGRDVHVLGYFVEPEAPSMVAHRERATNRRDERMHEMIEKLVAGGIEISFEQVEEAAGPDRGTIGRPHLAKALVASGHVASVQSAFNTLIGDDHDAFVPTHLLTPVEAVELILAAQGLPIWAHPPGDLVDPLLPELVRAGLRGLEVYRPTRKKHDTLRYERICRSSGLLMSGGSDWHTPDGGRKLGDFFVEAMEIDKLLEAGGL